MVQEIVMRLTLGIALARVFVHGFLSGSEKGKWIVFLKWFWYSVISLLGDLWLFYNNLKYSTWDSAQKELTKLNINWDSFTVNQLLKTYPPMEKACLIFKRQWIIMNLTLKILSKLLLLSLVNLVMVCTKLIGPELVQIIVDKVKVIKKRMKEAQNQQKSYVNNRRRPLEFQIGDMVFLKVAPWKHVIRFGMKDKLTPRYCHNPILTLLF